MLDRVGRNRENEAFGIGFMDALYGYALMLTRNSVEAEDLVQETYVRALKAQHMHSSLRLRWGATTPAQPAIGGRLLPRPL
jgi:hypothetical protein